MLLSQCDFFLQNLRSQEERNGQLISGTQLGFRKLSSPTGSNSCLINFQSLGVTYSVCRLPYISLHVVHVTVIKSGKVDGLIYFFKYSWGS